nr:MAG TPA: hypothetical protein [Caudoviricetes sp.]
MNLKRVSLKLFKNQGFAKNFEKFVNSFEFFS